MTRRCIVLNRVAISINQSGIGQVKSGKFELEKGASVRVVPKSYQREGQPRKTENELTNDR